MWDAMREIVGRGILLSTITGMLFGASVEHGSAADRECRPATYECYLSLGRKYEAARQFEPAIAAFTEAAIRKSDAYEPYLRLGIIYTYQSRWEMAIGDATRAINLTPNFALPYMLRGTDFLGEGSYDQAIADETYALKLDNSHQDAAYMARGAALASANRAREAVRDFSKAIGINGDHPAAFYSRALAYEEMGERDLAGQDYISALALLNRNIAGNPQDGLWYEERGFVYERMGHPRQAIADETRALALDCDGPAYAHVDRALADDDEGAHEEAAADLQSAIRIDKYSRLEWDQIKRIEVRSRPQ
jgi:tetratricopeptide (TPR) repeat protein